MLLGDATRKPALGFPPSGPKIGSISSGTSIFRLLFRLVRCSGLSFGRISEMGISIPCFSSSALLLKKFSGEFRRISANEYWALPRASCCCTFERGSRRKSSLLGCRVAKRAMGGGSLGRREAKGISTISSGPAEATSAGAGAGTEVIAGVCSATREAGGRVDRGMGDAIGATVGEEGDATLGTTGGVFATGGGGAGTEGVRAGVAGEGAVGACSLTTSLFRKPNIQCGTETLHKCRFSSIRKLTVLRQTSG